MRSIAAVFAVLMTLLLAPAALALACLWYLLTLPWQRVR